MKGKGTLVLTTLILILSFSVNLELNSQINVEATNGYLVHNLDTGLNYTSIQEAINAPDTLTGHTVFVEEGTYYEHIIVNKSISLVGENRSTTIIDGNNNGPVIRIVTNNVSVSDLTIQNSGYCTIINGEATIEWYQGICIDHSFYNNISHNIIANNGYGVQLNYSDHNTIDGNIISANCDGIRIQHSNENVLSNNSVSSKYCRGMHFVHSDNNILTANIISSSEYGVYVHLSNNNTFSVNTYFSNKFGLWLVDSINNIIVGNNVLYNYYGIVLQYSSNNVFFYNNFIDSIVHQVHDLAWYNPPHVVPLSFNMWSNNYTSEGNYWSDHIGTDVNSDGIGDTLYIIDTNNTDNYPLIGIFSSFNTSLGKYVNVISNSTIDDFMYYESNSTIKMHVSNMIGGQTHGFVRIIFPHTLMTEPYNITVDGVNPTYWNYTLYDNGTHRWIYFEYEHSTLEIVIIPESPSLIKLPLFMIGTLIAVLVYRRRKTSKVHKSSLAYNW